MVYGREVRVTQFQPKGMRKNSFRWLQFLLIGIMLAGCAVPPPAASVTIPNTGAAQDPALAAEIAALETSASIFRVIEYPLVEQSTDNPDHPAFADRAIQAVAARRAGFGLFRPVDIVEAPNQMLKPFGYEIAHSDVPPFSSYVLFHQGAPVVRDISRFWQVNAGSAEEFVLVMETLTGEVLAASNGSVDLIVAADAEVEDRRLVYAGDASLLPIGNAASAVSGAIYQQEIGGEPLVLYHRDRLAQLSYAGQELAYTYDAVMYAGGPESAMYNPGSSGRLMWFYALRDGLWYYVEAGLIE